MISKLLPNQIVYIHIFNKIIVDSMLGKHDHAGRRIRNIFLTLFGLIETFDIN